MLSILCAPEPSLLSVFSDKAAAKPEVEAEVKAEPEVKAEVEDWI